MKDEHFIFPKIEMYFIKTFHQSFGYLLDLEKEYAFEEIRGLDNMENLGFSEEEKQSYSDKLANDYKIANSEGFKKSESILEAEVNIFQRLISRFKLKVSNHFSQLTKNVEKESFICQLYEEAHLYNPMMRKDILFLHCFSGISYKITLYDARNVLEKHNYAIAEHYTPNSFDLQLSLTDYGNGTALLSGIPSNSHIGANNVKLRVNDGAISTDQDFIITVSDQVNPPLSILQEVISSGGDYSIKSGGTISYTFGETIIETLKGPNITLTQGFQQTNLMINTIDESQELNFDISAFPNPVAEYVKLRIGKENLSGMQFLLYDLNGKLLLQKRIEDTETEIPFYDLSPAGYILKVTDHDKEVKTFKIVKTH